MENKIQLSPKKIYNKQFQVNSRGYDANEVDNFLDVVMQDYYSFKEMIDEANNYIEKLQNEIDTLKETLASTQEENEVLESNAKKLEEELSPQLDILQRLSALEKAVFKTNE